MKELKNILIDSADLVEYAEDGGIYTYFYIYQKVPYWFTSGGRVTSQEKRKGYDIWFHIVKRDGNVFITRYDYTGNNFSLDVDQKTFHMSLIFEQTDYNQHNEPVIQGIRYLSPTTIVYYKAE
jgi:hypothetical protein